MNHTTAICPPNAAHAEQWVQQLTARTLPVLQATREALASWRQVPDRVDAHSLADIVLRDPLMTLRLLAHIAQGLGQRLATPVSTVTAALVLLGIEPFYREFANLTTLEEQFAGDPEALTGAMKAIERAHEAATLAANIAIERQDDNVEAVHEAALLANVAHLLLWCEAPEQALALQALGRSEPEAPHEALERELLGVELHALGHVLMERVGLAHLLGITPAAAIALALRLD